MNTVEIVIENTSERRFATQGISLAQLAQDYYTELGRFPLERPILGALVNNTAEDLHYRIYNPKTIRFFDIDTPYGWRIYLNSLTFLLYKAVRECVPEARLSVHHSMQGGFYCTLDSDQPIADHFKAASDIREKMIELQHQDIPFESRTLLQQDAADLLRQAGLPKALSLVESCGQCYVNIHFLGDTVHKMATKLVPSTGCLKAWDFRPYEEGYILQMPDPNHLDKLPITRDTPKLFNIFQEHRRWAQLLQVPTISDLNRIVRDKGENHLIQVSEALHEKKYAEIADMIYQRRDSVRMVLLAGPSSSGKTTSCRRLSVQLSVLGFDVKQLSLDDYFVCRERTPKLPNGEYDFETIDALDIPLLNEHLQQLFAGQEVQIPTFDFVKGNPYYSGKTLQLGPRSILVVEGIHALNPKLTAQIDDALKFRVYVSALTQISIDGINSIRSSDNRLIRRIVRDNNFRGWDAFNTIHRWQDVRRGEEIHIFPYQENADVMFNSALMYELGVLKVFAEPQLKRVAENCIEHAEAKRLLDFIELIEPIDPKHIPPTSIMREFLGGSSFSY